MRVLITGGAGFIGSHLVERLLSLNHTVAVLDDLSAGQMDNLAGARQSGARFSFTEGSVLDRDLVTRMTIEADCVFHLAAAVGVRMIMDQPSQGILTNFIGTERVLEACLTANTRVFIASTSEVYGKAASFPQTETDDLIIGASEKLRWSYACTKLLDEFLTLSYVRERGLPATVLRFFNTTGPRQTGRYGMVIPSFVDAAIAGKPLSVYGSGQQSRCFCHVTDVVEALVRLADTPSAVGEVINVGNDVEVTILGLAQKIVDATGSASEIEIIPYDQAYGPGFEDMQRRKPDISKLQAITGYRPGTPLDSIIRDVIRHRRDRG